MTSWYFNKLCISHHWSCVTLPRSYLLFERDSSRPQLPRKGDRNDFSWTCILCLLMYVLFDFIDHSWLWYLFIHQVMDDVNRVLTQMRKFTEVCSISSSSLSLSSLAGQWHPPVFSIGLSLTSCAIGFFFCLPGICKNKWVELCFSFHMGILRVPTLFYNIFFALPAIG